MWCKMMTGKVLSAGGMLCGPALAVASVALLRFDDPRWAWRCTLVMGVGGDVLGAYAASSMIKRLHFKP